MKVTNSPFSYAEEKLSAAFNNTQQDLETQYFWHYVICYDFEDRARDMCQPETVCLWLKLILKMLFLRSIASVLLPII